MIDNCWVQLEYWHSHGATTKLHENMFEGPIWSNKWNKLQDIWEIWVGPQRLSSKSGKIFIYFCLEIKYNDNWNLYI
jgi:hypothetical protein